MKIYGNICKYIKYIQIYANITKYMQIYANICSVSEFPFSGIIWAVRISNSEFAEELFGGFEFRITDSHQIYLSAFRISN